MSANRIAAATCRAGPTRVGVFGGTFDPPHCGHERAAVEAAARAGLDLVLWVVARDPWQKDGEVVASAEDRFALVEACVAELGGHEASRVEMDRPGPSYMVDTLDELRAAHPAASLHLIFGADVAESLATWHRSEEVGRLAEIVVVDRAPEDVSSTEVRKRLAHGEPVDSLLAEPVIREIERRGLYRRG